MAGAAANSALSGPGLDNLTTTWNGSGDADVELPQFNCVAQCQDPNFWPGGPTFLWSLPGIFTDINSPPSPPTIASAPPHSAADLGKNCVQYFPSSGFAVRQCRTLASFTANGSPNGDNITVTTLMGGDAIDVTVSAGDGDDLVSIGGFGSRVINGGDEPLDPEDPERDMLAVLNTGGGPNTTWNVNLQTQAATPDTGASAMSLAGFEGASMFSANAGNPGHTLIGNAVPNILSGAGGNDLLQGFGEDDSLGGFTGDDTLQGGDGDDVIYAGYGSDTLTGGPGKDEFWCADDDGDPGTDMVTDNVPGEELHFCDIQTGSLLPDAAVRRSKDTVAVGNDVYEATPDDQVVSWSAKKGQSRTFPIDLEYDGTGTGLMTVDGCSGNSKFAGEVRGGGGRLTAAVAAGTYRNGDDLPRWKGVDRARGQA